MTKLEKIISNVSAINNSLYLEQRKIQNVLDILGLTAKFDCGFYVKEYSDDPRSNVTIFEDHKYISLNNFLIECVGEVDYPVTKSQGKQIADLFEFTPKQLAMILDKCATEKEYDDYVDYERRANDF